MHCFLAALPNFSRLCGTAGALRGQPPGGLRAGHGARVRTPGARRPLWALRRALSVVLTGEVPVFSLSPGEVVALPAEGESQRSGF